MTLLRKSEILAKKNGVRIKPELARALRAVQTMHELAKKSDRSACRMYVGRDSRGR